MNKKLVIALVALLLVLVVLVIVLNQVLLQYNKQNQDDGVYQPSDTASTATKGETMDYCVAVNTVYGVLYYQDQWIDYMVVQQEQSATVLTVIFQAEMDGKMYSLFTLTIGSQTGSVVGRITDADGTQRGVVAVMSDLGDISHLTENERNRLYAMQEDINFVIANLK